MLAGMAGAMPAHADCAKGEAQCPSNTGGGCAPVGSICCPNSKYSVIGAACSGEQQGDWGAIAIVTWTDGSGAAHAAYGLALHAKTLSQASTRALLDCQADSNQVCHIVSDFNDGGCGYIAIGSSAKEVRWAVSPSSDQASKDCTQNGNACKAPAGGCTNKP
jgi:hypothetical protein